MIMILNGNLLLTVLISSSFVEAIGENDAGRGGKQPPNIIFIVGDDIGYNDVGWHNEQMLSPFMNSLAQNGTILENYYTFSVCTPSRAALLTGQYATRLGLQTGVLMNQEPYGIPLRYQLLPQRLREVGYSTHALGKWHLGYCDWRYTPTYRGFDSFLGFYNGAEENYLHCVGRNYFYTKENCTGMDFWDNSEIGYQYTGQYSSEVYADRAEKIIRSHNKNYPLFLYISLVDTHFPLQAPQRYMDMCSNTVSEARQKFCATMASMDFAVQRITEVIVETGLYDNSVIVFVSDNGGPIHFGANNYPLRGEKNSIWEGGTRVPAFVHSPLLKYKGTVNKGLIHAVDWFPTFLRLAGAKQETDIDGIDQWDTINDNKQSRSEIFYNYVETPTYISGAIRDEKFKLIAGFPGTGKEVVLEKESEDYSYDGDFMIAYTNFKQPEITENDRNMKLYNLEEDPSESNDLASTMPEKVEELMQRLMVHKNRAKNPVKFTDDPRGNPENFNRVYSPGWCKAFYEVPGYETRFVNNEINAII